MADTEIARPSVIIRTMISNKHVGGWMPGDGATSELNLRRLCIASYWCATQASEPGESLKNTGISLSTGLSHANQNKMVGSTKSAPDNQPYMLQHIILLLLVIVKNLFCVHSKGVVHCCVLRMQHTLTTTWNLLTGTSLLGYSWKTWATSFKLFSTFSSERHFPLGK